RGLGLLGALVLAGQPVLERRALHRPTARDCLRPPGLEPSAEHPGRAAGVPVVVGQVGEVLFVAIAQPRLVRDDRESCLGQGPRSSRQVELLDPLDRVRLDGRANALMDDVVEVDQDAATEQSVYLVDPGAMTLYQAFDRSGLVPRVVVDVHPRVSVQTMHDEVDEPLKRGLLAVAVHDLERVYYGIR